MIRKDPQAEYRPLRCPRETVLFLALATVLGWAGLLSGCKGPGPSVTRIHGSVLVALPEEGIVRIPCIVYRGSESPDDRCRNIGRIESGVNQTIDRVGCFKGTCGSPVLGDRGECLGAMKLLVFDSNSPTFGFTSRGDLDEVWTFGRASARRRGREAASMALEGAPMEPGESVSALVVWGDACSGPSGAITEVRGREVVAIGHGIRESGACEYAMARASWTSIDLPGNSGASAKASHGSIVGTFLYDSTFGLYGIAGLEPDGIRMRFQTSTGQGRKASRNYSIARSLEFFPNALSFVSKDVISSLLRDADENMVSYTITWSNGTATTGRVLMTPTEGLYRALRDLIDDSDIPRLAALEVAFEEVQ